MNKQEYYQWCISEVVLGVKTHKRLKNRNRRRANQWLMYAREMWRFAQSIRAMTYAEYRQWLYEQEQAELEREWREAERLFFL